MRPAAPRIPARAARQRRRPPPPLLSTDSPSTTHGAASPEPAAPAERQAPSLRRGIGWSLVALVASKTVSFVAVLILARLLVPAEFGVVAAITTYLTFLQIISDVGVKAVVVYEQEQDYGARVQTAFTLNLVVVAIATGIGLLLAIPAAEFFGAGDHRGLFLLCVLSLTFAGVGNIHDGLLLRDLSLGKRVLPQLIRGVVQGVVSVALAVGGLGASAMVIGAICGALAWTLAQWTSTPFRPTMAFDGRIARSMVRYAAGAWFVFVTSWLSIQADVIVVGHQLDNRDLGVYTMAYRLPELLVFNVAWTLSTVAFPALARQRAQHGGDVAESTVRLIHYLALYALPVAAGLAVLAQPIVHVLFSTTWSAAGPVLSGVAVAVALVTVATPILDAGRAVGKQRTLALLYVAHIPLVVVAVVVASGSGPTAVAWANVAATVVFLVALLGWSHAALGIRIGRLAVALRAPIAAAVGVCLIAGPIRLLLMGTVPDALVLVLGGVGCLAGAVGGARLLAPGTLSDLVDALGVRPRIERLVALRGRHA